MGTFTLETRIDRHPADVFHVIGDPRQNRRSRRLTQAVAQRSHGR